VSAGAYLLTSFLHWIGEVRLREALAGDHRLGGALPEASSRPEVVLAKTMLRRYFKLDQTLAPLPGGKQPPTPAGLAPTALTFH
jgi:hypothetical protein